MSTYEWWSLKGWRFELCERSGGTYFSVPDKGGMTDMVPREPAQLAWAERRLEGLPGLKQVWNTSWEITGPEGLEALRALWVKQGGSFEAGSWAEEWSLGEWRARLRRNRAGTIFHFTGAPGEADGGPHAEAQRAWAGQNLAGWPGIERAGLLWMVTSADGLEALRLVWAEAGGSMGAEIHPWADA